jgi:hypothetical protein
MTESILAGALGAEVGEALLDAGLYEDLTLIVVTPGGGPAHDPDPPVETPYPCRGYIGAFSDEYLTGSGLVEAGDIRVDVIGTTLSIEPRIGDKVEVRGRVYHIVNVSGDPAGALDILHGRLA